MNYVYQFKQFYFNFKLKLNLFFLVTNNFNFLANLNKFDSNIKFRVTDIFLFIYLFVFNFWISILIPKYPVFFFFIENFNKIILNFLYIKFNLSKNFNYFYLRYFSNNLFLIIKKEYLFHVMFKFKKKFEGLINKNLLNYTYSLKVIHSNNPNFRKLKSFSYKYLPKVWSKTNLNKPLFFEYFISLSSFTSLILFSFFSFFSFFLKTYFYLQFYYCGFFFKFNWNLLIFLNLFNLIQPFYKNWIELFITYFLIIYYKFNFIYFCNLTKGNNFYTLPNYLFIDFIMIPIVSTSLITKRLYYSINKFDLGSININYFNSPNPYYFDFHRNLTLSNLNRLILNRNRLKKMLISDQRKFKIEAIIFNKLFFFYSFLFKFIQIYQIELKKIPIPRKNKITFFKILNIKNYYGKDQIDSDVLLFKINSYITLFLKMNKFFFYPNNFFLNLYNFYGGFFYFYKFTFFTKHQDFLTFLSYNYFKISFSLVLACSFNRFFNNTAKQELKWKQMRKEYKLHAKFLNLFKFYQKKVFYKKNPIIWEE